MLHPFTFIQMIRDAFKKAYLGTLSLILSCLERQVHEGIRISTEGALNSKTEWRQNQLKRISVHLTERELKEVEKELSAGEKDLKIAISNLNNKLNNN